MLETPEAANGLALMENLVRGAETQGPSLEFPVGEGIKATVLRASRPVLP